MAHYKTYQIVNIRYHKIGNLVHYIRDVVNQEQNLAHNKIN